MEAKDKSKYIAELKAIISKIDVNKLIISPDEELNRQDIRKAGAIFTNFDYSTGAELKALINEFLKIARAGKRTTHTKNLANDIKNFIVQKTEDIKAYKIGRNRKPVKKKYIFSLLLGAVILILIIFFNWKLSGISLGPLKFGPSNESVMRPDLQFDDMEFVYYDLEEKPISNKPDIKYIIDLNKVSAIGFIGTIKNVGNVNLLLTFNNIILETSKGQIIYNEPPSIPAHNVSLVAGETLKVMMKGIKASALLESFENNKNFFLIFKPEIEYFMEDKPETKYYFEEMMICGNNYSNDLLPQFGHVCHREKK